MLHAESRVQILLMSMERLSTQNAFAVKVCSIEFGVLELIPVCDTLTDDSVVSSNACKAEFNFLVCHQQLSGKIFRDSGKYEASFHLANMKQSY